MHVITHLYMNVIQRLCLPLTMSFRIFMWTGHFHIWLVPKPSWNKMMLDLVISQVMVIYSWQLLQALIHIICIVFVFLMYVFNSLSRNVSWQWQRQCNWERRWQRSSCKTFFLFVTVFFKVLNLSQEIKHFCIYLCNSIQMRTSVRRRRRVTIILRR